MNVMTNGGAPAPGMNMNLGGGDMLSTLLLLQVLCPGMFAGNGMGENPLMTLLMMHMLTGRGM